MNLSESLDETMRQLRAQKGRQEITVSAGANPPRDIAEANMFLAWGLQRAELVDTKSAHPVFHPERPPHVDYAPYKYYHPLLKSGEVTHILKSPLDEDGLKSISAFFERVKAFSKSGWTISHDGPIATINKPLPPYDGERSGEKLDKRRMHDLLAWEMHERNDAEFPMDHSMHRTLLSYMKSGSPDIDDAAVRVSPYCHFAGNNSLYIQNEEGPAFVRRMTGVDLGREITQGKQ